MSISIETLIENDGEKSKRRWERLYHVEEILEGPLKATQMKY